jgi:hypothetical protein
MQINELQQNPEFTPSWFPVNGEPDFEAGF